jgi:type IV pilus assembly protein PilB
MQTIRPIPKLPTRKKLPVLRIGELLIKEGFIQHGDIEHALEVQKRGAQEASQPLGELMVKKKMISDQDLDRLLNHPDLRKNLGTLLLEKKLIGEKKLMAALELKSPDERLGQSLIRRGVITKTQLEALLEQQENSVRIGELANNLGLINEADLDKAVRIKSGHRTIGEILCDLKRVTIDDLNYILPKYGKKLKLGDILIKQGLISEGQYQKAIQDQHHTRKKLGRCLIDQGAITVDQLYMALSRQFNIPYRTLGGFEFDSRQLRMLTGVVGEKYARKHNILPLSLWDDRFQIGIASPDNISSIAGLNKLYPDLKVEPVLIRQKKYGELFATLYSAASESRTHKGVEGIQDMELIELNLREDKLQEDAAQADDMLTEQVVDYIIRLGISKEASDIHIEQDRQGARLRYRTDGICKEVEVDWLNEKLQEMPSAIISRIKVLSNLDIAERRLPQDGVFRVNYYDSEQDRRYDLDFRVATCPAIVGENVTIRILDSRKAKVGLESLNHSPHVLEPLKRLFKSAAGMVLVTGPTGSGKSSTLYAALRYIYHPGIKIITAEDPIEYSFPGIMQTQVKPKIGLNFIRLLRSFLRSDPDVILVGEIRDDETASIAFDAAQTGHLMLSTLHTNDAVSAVSRLLDLDIEYGQIASSLIGVLAQRLVRRTCPTCRLKYDPPEEEWRLFFNTYPDHLTFYKGMGCKSCGYTGYKGRTLISELFELNREIALAMGKGINETQIKRMALDLGMKTMIDDGLLKLDQITLTEIIRVVPIEMIKEFASRGSNTAPCADTPYGVMPSSYSERISIELGPPEKNPLAINSLFERYQTMCRHNGQAPTEAAPDMFRQSIGKTFQQIVDRYGCERVHFEFVSQNGKIKINATPVEER